MRRLYATSAVATIVVASFALAAVAAFAQETMTFHPLPAESLARVERERAGRGSLKVTGRDGRGRPFNASVDSNGVQVNLPGASIPVPPASPEPPTPPEPLESSSGDRTGVHETTGDVVRFGSDIEVPAHQVVEGDVVSMGGSVRVDGVVKGSVTSMGGDVTLGPSARVDRDVVCFGGTLREMPGSSVGGQRVTAPRVPGSHMLTPMLSVVSTGVRVVTHIVSMLFMLLLAFVLIKLAPGRTEDSLRTVREEPAASFLVGLMILGLLVPSVVVLAIAAAILCITIIGIPLAVAVLVGYAMLLALAAVWGAVIGNAFLGANLHARFKGAVATTMTAAVWGIVTLYGLRIAGDFIHVVPVFGFLAGLIKVVVIATSAIISIMGAGALVRSEYRRRTVQNWWARSRPRRTGTRAEDDFPPPPAPGPMATESTPSASSMPPPAPPAPPTEPPPAPVM
jgi:hypothetical protein